MPETSHDGDHSLTVRGAPLHRLVEQRAGSWADELVAVFATEIPQYGQLPDEAMIGEVRQMIRHNLELVAVMFRENRALTPAELDMPRKSAARRAQERFPLEAILTAYHLGVRRLTAEMFQDADPADFDAITAAYALVMVYTQDVTAAVCAGYTAERETMLSQEQDARHVMVSALLNGDRSIRSRALAGVRLASDYLVLTMIIGPHPDEDAGDQQARYAGRRKLGRIRAVLDAFASEPVLSVIDSDGGLVLVPIPESRLDWNSARHLVDVMVKAAGAPIWSAGEICDVDAVGQAAGTVQEVLDVVRTFGYPPGLYRLSDVLLEYQLTQPSPAMVELAKLLDPLDGNPDLLRTIEAHLETGLDRRRTASLLHIHPNTVDYRLRRVVQLTGLDPTDPPQLQRIGAALAARRKLLT